MRSVWNEAALRPERELKERDYLWASQLSRPLVDNYLSLKATKVTNPPNMRSRRKFLMGIMIEEMQGIIFTALGLRVNKQEEVWTHGVLPVKGKIDFLVQGIPDYEKARHNISQLGFSQEFVDYMLAVVDRFESIYGQADFAPMVRDCKSISEYAIQRVQNGSGIIGHRMQLYHYLKGLNLPLGYVDYISKGDAIMEESKVEYPNTELEAQYNNTLEKLRGYLDANEQPPVEKLITWEGKFSKNLDVEYSNYLTLLYGFDTPDDYRASVVGKISSWNRVLKRLKDVKEGKTTPSGKPITLTDKNKKALDELRAEGYDPDYLVMSMTNVAEDEEE